MKKYRKIFLLLVFILLLMPVTALAGDETATTIGLTCNDVHYASDAYLSLRIIAPFLLILFGSIDFFKAVTAGDQKKQQEARSKFPKRLIAFALLLILPFVVQFIFKTFGTFSSNNMTVFCCIATHGDSNCDIGVTSGNDPIPDRDPTNIDDIDEVTDDNLCNGSNYLSPMQKTTRTDVSGCINNRRGTCESLNISDGTCRCRYTYVPNIPEDKCSSNCGVGYYSGACYFNAVIGASSSQINNISNSGLSLIKKVHQAGTTGDYFDGYFQYDMHIKTNVTQSVCTGELRGIPYSCNSNGTKCSCLYGNGISSTSSEQVDSTELAEKKARYNELVDILNDAQQHGSIHYNTAIASLYNELGAVPSCAGYPLNGGFVVVANYLNTKLDDTTNSIGHHFNAAMNNSSANFSSSLKSCIKEFYSIHGVDVDSMIYHIPHYGDAVQTANNAVTSLNRAYWDEGYNVFLAHMEEFNELNEYFNKPRASVEDFNTDKLYEKIE